MLFWLCQFCVFSNISNNAFSLCVDPALKVRILSFGLFWGSLWLCNTRIYICNTCLGTNSFVSALILFVCLFVCLGADLFVYFVCLGAGLFAFFCLDSVFLFVGWLLVVCVYLFVWAMICFYSFVCLFAVC